MSSKKIYLSERESEESSKLMISRILRRPIEEMSKKVDNVISGNSTSDLKMMIYSAHDDQVANMLNFLSTDYHWVQYASTVSFELKYSVSCLNSDAKSEDCFGVSVRSNGSPLLLDGCSGDGFTLEGCTWNEFETFMMKRWYGNPKSIWDSDLDGACSRAPPAPP